MYVYVYVYVLHNLMGAGTLRWLDIHVHVLWYGVHIVTSSGYHFPGGLYVHTCILPKKNTIVRVIAMCV